MLSEIKTVNIGGVKTACISRKALALKIGEAAINSKLEKPILIFDSNGHGISEANKSSKYMSMLNKADIIHADGMSVVKFSKYIYPKRQGIPEATPTTDMIHEVPEYNQDKINHFLLGGKEEVVKKAAEMLSELHSKFVVCGYNNGYFPEDEEQHIIDKINKSGCQVLWVGLGKPKEQEFCIRNKEKFECVKVIITCGGCYNYITGEYKRAPKWMQNCGLEWLHRMLKQPRHLFWRYLTTNPHAIYCMLKNKNKQT
ncbi:MAG: wecB/TagA/CpsF family glycosyl transferase [Osedax symbiont Rs2]|nr:MAG: wecB/TagA/CpsF family glycosyl transferase [Osedax symbiont Rs2]